MCQFQKVCNIFLNGPWRSNIILTAGFIFGEVFCNDWSKACGSMCSKIFNRQNQTGKVSGQKQEYQRQGRDVNNTRQKSGSQAQVQNSKVGQSGVKHRDNKQQDE